jgi:hypothetical protein
MLMTAISTAWPEKVSDSCGQFFGTALRAAHPDIRPDARVLEIGCCEYDWLKQATTVWPEMTFTGIDWRHYKRPGRATVIRGDVMTQVFEPASFDWIVSISAIEHIGLGHYGHDPTAEDGDAVTIAKCWDWLSPGGWLSFDVPYNPGRYQVVGTSHRIYDNAAIAARLHQGRPWIERWRGVVKRGHESVLVTDPQPTAGGEDFYFIGFCWQKPGA